MYPEIVAVIIAVRDPVTAKRYVTNRNVKLIVREARVLEAFNLHIGLRIQFRRYSAR